jgi:N-acetylneuraminic acid mutarotase
VADVILLFGGRQDRTHIEDFWSYKTSTNTWTQIGSITEADLTLTYHSGAKQVVLYAGRTFRRGWSQPLGRTLTYDYMTNTKESMKADGTPFGYAGAQLAYDEESNVVILFGGFFMEVSDIGQIISTQLIDETFAYDLNTNTWTNMVPTTNPPGRQEQAMVYHPTLDRVVMFGGDLYGGEGLVETWMYDYNTNSWELIPVLNAPPDRAYSAMVYISSTDQILLFGGFSTKDKDVLNDLWAFDHDENKWIELHPDNAPSIRAYHAMAYDSNADKVILFGGGASPSKLTNETWIYDPQTNAWTEVTPGN